MAFNKGINIKRHFHGGAISLSLETFLVIRIPNALVLRILSRSLFLAMVLATLPFLRTIPRGFSSTYHSNHPVLPSGSLDLDLLNLIFLDFAADEGLLRENDKVLVVNSPFPDGFGDKIDVVVASDFERKDLFSDESYDFVFTSGSIDAEKLVQQFVDSDFDCSPRRNLLETGAEALKGLEDVLWKPLRKASVKLRKYFSNIKYLPNLLGDSLKGYKKKVFIGVRLPKEQKGVM
ncbi:hypothetical protein Fmac_021344 [Flemingia macrophylla]|uniref:DUF7870 domain-containing protein n=1 Tax=Flemingia macrophylla TaxID=520843 RepID=A0ABD1LWU1_9FABA